MMEFLQEFLTAALRFLLLVLVWKSLFAWAPRGARHVAGALRRRNIRVRYGSLTPEEKFTLDSIVLRRKRVFCEVRRRPYIQSLVNKGAIQFREPVRGDFCIYQVADDWWESLNSFRAKQLARAQPSGDDGDGGDDPGQKKGGLPIGKPP